MKPILDLKRYTVLNPEININPPRLFVFAYDEDDCEIMAEDFTDYFTTTRGYTSSTLEYPSLLLDTILRLDLEHEIALLCEAYPQLNEAAYLALSEEIHVNYEGKLDIFDVKTVEFREKHDVKKHYTEAKCTVKAYERIFGREEVEKREADDEVGYSD